MPRKAPSDVIEQRITLGSFERQLLGPMIAAQKRDAYLKTALYGTVGLAGIATIGTMTWLGIQAYALVGGAQEELAAKWEEAKEAAQNIWSGPETVSTTQPPPSDIDRSGTVGDDLGLNEFLDGIIGDTRDPDDPTKRINPAAGFPVPGVGWLFGQGMKFGEKSFTVTEKAARSKKNPLNWLP